MKTKTFQPRVGDTVAYYARSYIRGTRGPGNPNGRFRYSFRCNAVLLAKNDLRSWKGGSLAGGNPTQEEVDAHLGTHLGLINAAGAGVAGDLTEGNNPLLLPSGEVVWVYADQVRKAK